MMRPKAEVAKAEEQADEFAAKVAARLAERRAREEAEAWAEAAAEVAAEEREAAARSRSFDDWQAQLGPLGWTVVRAVWPDCPIGDVAKGARLELEEVKGPVPVAVRTPWSLTDDGVVYTADDGRGRVAPYLVCSPVFQVSRGAAPRGVRYEGDGTSRVVDAGYDAVFAVRSGRGWKTVSVRQNDSAGETNTAILKALATAGLTLNSAPRLVRRAGDIRTTGEDPRALLLKFLDAHETQVPPTRRPADPAPAVPPPALLH